MNIVVLLRAGRDPASFTVNRKAQKIFVHRDEWRVTPADLNALEAALQLAGSEHTVVAVSIGGPEAQEALYLARAMGAARALQVAGLAEPEAGQIVAIVNKALEHLGGADLVLMGATVHHADLAQVAPRLAEQLGWPLVDVGLGLQVSGDGVLVAVADGEVCASRLVRLPAVVTIAEDGNQPRFAPAPAIIRAYADPGAVEVISASDLGLVEAELRPQVIRRGEVYPPERTFGQRLEGSVDEVAQQLAAELWGKA